MLKKILSCFLAFALMLSYGVFIKKPNIAYAATPVTCIQGMAFSKQVNTAPVIDGNLNDANWNLTTSVTNIIDGTSTDNTVTFDTAWDSTNLYVAVKVLDTNIVNNHHDSNLYEDDCVEIFLDGDNSKNLSYDTDDYQIFVRSDNTVIVNRSNSAVSLPGLVTAVGTITGGYTVELQIPWASIGITPKEGNCIGFDVGNDDNDSIDGVSGRSAAVSWNATQNTNWGNPSTFGTLFLTEKQDPVISTAGTPSIDGNLDESDWHLDKSFTVTSSENNNSVSFGSLCDQNYLYIGAEVMDGTLLHENADYYNNDSLELFINPDNSKSTTYGPNDKHYAFTYGVNGIVDAMGGSTAGIQAKYADITGGYTVEIAIPWTTLGITPSNYCSLGFDIQNNDSDISGSGTKQGVTIWNGDGNNWQSTAKFGSLIIDNNNIVVQSYTGPKATFTDPAVDTSNVYDKSSSVCYWTQTYGDLGDLSTLSGGDVPGQYIIYKSPSEDILSFQIDALENNQPWLDIYTSSDNVTYSKLAPGVQYNITTVEAQSDANGWFNVDQYKSSNVPAGTRYIKIVFTTDANMGWQAHINNVTFDYKLAYTGQRGVFTDPAVDTSNVYDKSSSVSYWTQTYGDLGDLSTLSGGDVPGQYVIYKSPSGEILSFQIDALENNQPWLEIYTSSDNKTYTKLTPNLQYNINTIQAQSDANGWFNVNEYQSISVPSGTMYIKILFTTAANMGWQAHIKNVTFDYELINTPPTSLRDSYQTVQFNTPCTGSVDGKDADGDSLTYSISKQPAHGTAVISDSSQDLWSYTPDNNYVGFDTFQVKVDDGNGGNCYTKIVIHENYAPTNLNYYVDGNNGSDSNNGLFEATAFKTLQHAADVTKPGDTVHIMTATYTDDPINGIQAPLIINNSGLPNAYITYTADPGQHPVIHVTHQWNHMLIVASYIKVENLTVIGDAQNVSIADAETTYDKMVAGTANPSDPGVIASNANGINVRPTEVGDPNEAVTPHHIIIYNCNVSEIPGGGINAMLCDYVTIENCVVTDCAIRAAYANSGISLGYSQDIDNNFSDYKNIIKGNLVHDNRTMVKWYQTKDWSDGNGIIVDDNKNDQMLATAPYKATFYQGRTLIVNNIAYANGGSGIHTFASSNVDIINNTAYGNNVTPSENWGQIFAIAATNCRVINNIMYGLGGINQVNQASNINVDVTYDHNIYFNGVDKVKTGNNIVADPMFVDAANHDFHLQDGSPAIDAGAAVAAITDDFSGTPRPIGAALDIGAYEATTRQYVDDGIIPSTPPPQDRTPEAPKNTDNNIQAQQPIVKDGAAETIITSDTLNKALDGAKADENGVKTVTVTIPAASGANEYKQTLPVSALTSSNANTKVVLVTVLAQMEIPSNMLANLAVQASTVAVSVAKVDKTALKPEIAQQIGDRPVIELNAYAGGNKISWNNSQAPVKVTFKYTPNNNEEILNKEFVTVWYIDGEGNAVTVPSAKYDPATGDISFTTTHFGKYAVVYAPMTFSDLKGFDWAKHGIEVMATKGAVFGTRDKYNPSANITRGDSLTFLVNTLGLKADFIDNFSDVSKDANYYNAVGIAKKLGIVTGVGGGKFDPTAEISRQDLMVMIARALQLAKELNDGTNADLAAFTDAGKVADYAKASIEALVKAAIVQGSNNMIHPVDKTTRAEAAVLMYRLYNM